MSSEEGRIITPGNGGGVVGVSGTPVQVKLEARELQIQTQVLTALLTGEFDAVPGVKPFTDKLRAAVKALGEKAAVDALNSEAYQLSCDKCGQWYEEVHVCESCLKELLAGGGAAPGLMETLEQAKTPAEKEEAREDA